MENILVLTINKFPNKDAGAVRQFSFCQLLKELGYKPFVLCMGDSTNFEERDYEGVGYTSFRGGSTNIVARFLNFLNFRNRLRHYLYTCDIEYTAILVIDIPVNALFFVRRYGRKRGITLLHDSVEWYSKEQYKLGRFAASYVLKDCYNRYWINKDFRVIAISKFLKNHFESRKLRTVYIPVVLDILNMTYNKVIDSSKLTLMYAGAPHNKDYLKEIVEGFSLIEAEARCNVELRIIGVTREQLITTCHVNINDLNMLQGSIKLLGRVSRDQVIKNLGEADFTVLMRSPVLRYAKAGFPTKVVESLASGTPIMCNLTSDLGDYLVDGVNSIIVDDCSPQAFAESIKRALTLSVMKKKAMYQAARDCAEINFDFRRYKNEVASLLMAGVDDGEK